MLTVSCLDATLSLDDYGKVANYMLLRLAATWQTQHHLSHRSCSMAAQRNTPTIANVHQSLTSVRVQGTQHPP